jgi:hypothetical protein
LIYLTIGRRDRSRISSSIDSRGGKVHADHPKKRSFKQRVRHELKEAAILTGYLAFFFCALAAYSMLLLGKFQVSYFIYGTALFNALVIAKVILIGEALHAGTKYERKALLYSALWKAFVFGWLVFGFRLLEEMIRNVIHGESAARAFREIRLDELLTRTIIIICTFIPLFLFRELKRVMGDETFWTLVLHPPVSKSQDPERLTRL